MWNDPALLEQIDNKGAWCVVRKTIGILLAVILALVFMVCAGCGKFDPMKQYGELSKNGSKNKDRIQNLVERCIRKEYFEDAGKILSEELKAYRDYSYTLSDLQAQFRGHEQALDMAVWVNGFKESVNDDGYRKEQADGVFKILKDYNSIVYKHFADTEAALKFLTGKKLKDEYYEDREGTLLSLCGKTPKGKGLVYIVGPENSSSRINLSMMAGMPTDILPSSLDQVEYIVYMEYSQSRIGHYDNGGSAIRIDCTIRLEHLPDGKVLKTYAKANGGPPPEIISAPAKSSQGASGAYPRELDILYTLKSAFEYIQDPSKL
jgi:hypothetical protein